MLIRVIRCNPHQNSELHRFSCRCGILAYYSINVATATASLGRWLVIRLHHEQLSLHRH